MQALWSSVLFRSVKKLSRVAQSISMLGLREGVKVSKRVSIRERGYGLSFGFKVYFEIWR